MPYARKAPAGVRRKPFKRTSKRVMRAPSAKSLTALIKKVSLKTAEVKTRSYAIADTSLQQNTPQILEASLTSVPQGVSDASRIGDQIYVKGIRICVIMTSNVDHPNLMYKLAIIKTPLVNNTVLPYTYATWFRPTTNVWPLDTFNTDLVSVVATRTGKMRGSNDYSIEASSAQKECTNFINWYVPMKNLKVDYSTDAGVYPKNFSYQLIAMAYDTASTLSIDLVGKVRVCWDVVFSDP